jgi:hypothetical protein
MNTTIEAENTSYPCYNPIYPDAVSTTTTTKAISQRYKSH